jgi:hypothetical protein
MSRKNQSTRRADRDPRSRHNDDRSYSRSPSYDDDRRDRRDDRQKRRSSFDDIKYAPIAATTASVPASTAMSITANAPPTDAKQKAAAKKYNTRYISGQRANALKQCRYGGRYVPLDVIKEKITQWYSNGCKTRLASIQIPDDTQAEFWNFIVTALSVDIQQQFTSSGREAMPTNKTKPRKRSPKRKSIIDDSTNSTEQQQQQQVGQIGQFGQRQQFGQFGQRQQFGQFGQRQQFGQFGQFGQMGRSGGDNDDVKNVPPPIQQYAAAAAPTYPAVGASAGYQAQSAAAAAVMPSYPAAAAYPSAAAAASGRGATQEELARAFAAGIAAANKINGRTGVGQTAPSSFQPQLQPQSSIAQPLPPQMQRDAAQRAQIEFEIMRLNDLASGQTNRGRIPPVFQQLELGPDGGMYYRLPDDPTKVKYYTKAQKEQFLNGKKNPMCIGPGCKDVYAERRKFQNHQDEQQQRRFETMNANALRSQAQLSQQQTDIQRYQKILLEQQQSTFGTSTGMSPYSAAAAAAARTTMTTTAPTIYFQQQQQQPPPLQFSTLQQQQQQPIAFQRRPNVPSFATTGAPRN